MGSTSLLFARDVAQLEMRIGLRFVDGYRGLKPVDGLAGLAALLMDQPELILRLAIVWIDGGGPQ